MPRFFVASPSSDIITLSGAQASHIAVLRMHPGDRLTLCDGQGQDYTCEIMTARQDAVTLSILSVSPSGTEPSVTVRILMGMPKSDKFEHVVQKATELGASEISLFPARRSIVRTDPKKLERKLERYRSIAESAAEQSGRGRIPEVGYYPSYSAMLESCRNTASILFYENERTRTLHDALSAPFSALSLITGPEGGLEESEVAEASAAGCMVCTLGTRILRCETAPLCALSAVMYAAGEY